MKYKEIYINSLLNKITKKDNLFFGDYTADPYKNCEFGCLYCDSGLDKTIFVKTNAVEILEKELQKNEKGRIIIGSVHDPYQNIEKRTDITRDVLKIIKKYDFSCNVLTKSDLILRDIDILKDINDCTVTISLISLKEDISNIFEKNLPNPKKRLEIVKKLNANNIKSGVALIPILPFLIEEEYEEIIKQAKKNNSAYFLYKFLELKGDQIICFLDFLKDYKPKLLEKYKKLYNDSYYPNQEYISKQKNKIDSFCKKYKLKDKI
jgi:DNA repair photolyase